MPAACRSPFAHLDPATAARVLRAAHDLDAAWHALPPGGALHLPALAASWVDAPPAAAGGPLSPPTSPAHGDARLAGLALALDLSDLLRRHPAEPPDWRLRLALDRRLRLRFLKEAATDHADDTDQDQDR